MSLQKFLPDYKKLYVAKTKAMTQRAHHARKAFINTVSLTVLFNGLFQHSKLNGHSLNLLDECGCSLIIRNSAAALKKVDHFNKKPSTVTDLARLVTPRIV